jgi:hypothetical protein
LQTVLQPPQWLASVCRFVSQPFAGLPSQSPKPGLQAIVQEPMAQEGVPFVVLQALPHAPQFVALAARFVSQPLAGLPSQSAYVPVHDTTAHAPALQFEIAFGSAHALPHAPQFDIVSRLVSQPSAYMPLQSAQPALQLAIEHAEAVQAPVPFATVHTCPHVPQLFASVVRLVVHMPPEQAPNPAGHETVPHIPARQ